MQQVKKWKRRESYWFFPSSLPFSPIVVISQDVDHQCIYGMLSPLVLLFLVGMLSTKAEINGEPSTQKTLAAPQIRAEERLRGKLPPPTLLQNTVRRLFETPYLVLKQL